MPKCSVETCGRSATCRGWCNPHYQRWLRHGAPIELPTTEERFWRKVDRRGPDECWPWLASQKGALYREGTSYGAFKFEGRIMSAHRVAYLLAHGSIPAGHDICHRCDNRPCVNPAHLFAAPHQENMMDMVRKGRGRWDKPRD